MTATVSITEDQALTALRAFLVAVLDPSVEVIQGQENRVPEPMLSDFVVMSPSDRRRLATNSQGWRNPLSLGGKNWSAVAMTTSTQMDVDLEVHGPNGADNAQIITTLLRSDFAFQFMPPGVAPLYCDDALQLPFWNGEDQMEDRWICKAVLQINPTVTFPQGFADTLDLVLVEADVIGPPPAPWILATGFWSDAGRWRDNALWQDGP